MNSNKLIEILQKSVEKNGEKPLTNKWLLNLLLLAEKQEDEEKENIYSFDPNFD
jgi:hypothetical protein